MKHLSDKVVFLNLLKQSKGSYLKLQLKTDEKRLKDFSSYQYMYKETELEGIIINNSQYHIIVKVADKGEATDFRYVRLLDIESYETTSLIA